MPFVKQLLFSSCGLAPTGELNKRNGDKPKLINFAKRVKLGSLLSVPERYRGWHTKPGKEEKQSRNGGSFRESSSRKKGRKENSSVCNEKYFYQNNKDNFHTLVCSKVVVIMMMYTTGIVVNET